MRLDRVFLERLAAEDAALHARLMAARGAPDALSVKDESDLVVALGPHLDGFVAALFGIEAETLALARETHALDPIHACKRLFVQRQAVKKYPDPVRLRRRGVAGRAGGADRRGADRAGVRRAGRGMGEGGRCGGAGCGDALRRLGDADRGGRTRRIRATRCSACRTGSTTNHLVPVETIERDGVTMLRLPEARLAAARRIRADRCGNERAAGAGPDQLLHLVPHAGQGFLPPRAEGSQDRANSRSRRSA